jgi:hypothetical protein
MENASNYTKEEKDKLIKKEITRLKRIYKDLDKNKMDTAQSLIKNAAFMSITLDDLQETINRSGTICKYQNGENQWGYKKSPEVEVHIAMTKNHSAVMKQLSDMLPKQQPIQEDDGFDDFLNEK